MHVSSLMTPDPVTVSSHASLEEAVRLMDAHGVRHLPVLEDGGYAGVVSDRDLLRVTGWLNPEEGGSGDHRGGGPRVRDVAHQPAMSARPEDDVLILLVEAVVQGYGCVPVLQDGSLVGIVTELDLLNAYRRACWDAADRDCVDPPVREHMSSRVATIGPKGTLAQAARLCRNVEARHLPVVEEGRLLGILSDRDLHRAVGRGCAADCPVAELLTGEVVTVLPDDPLSKAAELLVRHRISSLPAVEGGRLAGILTVRDLLDHCVNALS